MHQFTELQKDMMKCVWCLSRPKALCEFCVSRLRNLKDISKFTYMQCREEIKKLDYALSMILYRLSYIKSRMKEYDIPTSVRVNKLYEHAELLMKRLQRVRQKSLTKTTKEG